MLKALAFVASMATLTIAAHTPSHDCWDITSRGCAYDCSPASKDGLQAECWKNLDLSGYLKDWVAQHGKEAGIDTKGFAQAYLSWSGYNGKTCNLITSETCDSPETDNSKYQNWQQFYTLWNIYAVHQFYNQYSTALSASQPLAASKLGQIVDKVSPTVEPVAGIPGWDTVLGASLSWACTFIGPAATSILPAYGTAGSLLLYGMAAAVKTPPVGQLAKHYTQTAQTRFQNLATIDADLANLVSGHQQEVAKEVQAMLDNLESFIALCSPGGFSTRITLSLPGESTALYKSLELYTLSQALNANGIVIAKSPGVDPRGVAKKTGEIICPGFGPAGNCYDWWYDSKSGNTYAFHDPKSERRDFTDLINYIWSENIVTDMADIFLTEDCVGKEPSIDSTNLKPTCASNTKMCQYNYDPNKNAEREKQFVNCPNDPDWGYQCSSFAETLILPLSYLGPLLKKGNYCRHQ
ncbi:hypothetical protein EJ03DRAFT_110827 [Teratosphaeria nubilosa]|uniref:Uncharacterized protein n=1 Tax=Teratosphaeria nubilosa TaxID=161662 RepID=A0A6G1L7L6_9PEZI|nr:hypothetical protein EJ03DRAFT_110827 [Teratosphaeria nubilosa]